MNELDLYGPPGTGKTTRLTRLALAAVGTLGGAEHLGAVTYTRAAAHELKARIAQALGVQVPAEPRMARMLLERTIPWVGTLHALCYKLLGRPPVISGKDLTDFAHSIDPRNNLKVLLPNSPDDVEGFEYGDVASSNEIELALQVHAMARHRMIPIPEAMRRVSLRSALQSLGPAAEQIELIAGKYEEFKQAIGKIDYEDMLDLGRHIPLPVRFLLCDEVQDNSALLWSVIDAWASHNLTGQVAASVMAGDPWQAIYLFSGASPDLFRKREGTWKTIGDSHRLSHSSATYALDLLRYAGYAEDSLLSTWTGKGGRPTEQGSQFYLARTNALLRPIRGRLEDLGVPYRLLRGTAPLQMKAAHTYRAWIKEEGVTSPITTATAALIADQAPSGSFPRGYKASIERIAAEDPDLLVAEREMPDLRAAIMRISYYDYYERVMKEHGIKAFVLPANTAVGTIHAAKGREADEVTVIRSWGFLPGQAISDGHHLEEACVAYVACTRHRSKLSFLDGFEGIPYPFPAQIGESTYVD